MLEIQSIKQCNSGKLIHLAHSIKKKNNEKLFVFDTLNKKNFIFIKKVFF